MAVSADPRIGSELAGYRIERLLGRGGMGVVYLAADLGLERNVALKLLAPELAEDGRFRERFLRESRVAASIDHPNVIPIFEAGEVEGVLFIAMRYVEGTDLERLLEHERRLEPARSIALLEQVAEALDVAHEHGLVHRDVKPSNILIAHQARREHVYLADFGLSRQLAAPGAVEASHFTGSVDYVAPEQVRRQPLDGRADLYELACVLHECLTGEPPFRRESQLGTLFAHLHDDPPPPSRTNPDLPAAVDPVLARALAKEPDERQPTCRELVEEARQALGVAATRPSWRQLPRRMKLAASLLALAIAAAAAVPALLLTGGGDAVAGTDSLVRIDRVSGEIEQRLRLGRGVNNVTVGAGYVWLTSIDDSLVWRVDPESGAVQRIPGIPEPRDLAVVGTDVFVAFQNGIGQVDAASAEGAVPGEGVTLTYSTIAAGPLGLWAASQVHTLDRIAQSGFGIPQVTKRVPVERTPYEDQSHDMLADVAVGETAVWASGGLQEHAVFRVDPRTDAVTRLPLPSATGSIAVGAGAVWVAGPAEDVLWRLDPVAGRVTDTIPVCRGPAAVSVDERGVWLACAVDGTIVLVDPGVRRVAETIEVGGRPWAIAGGGDALWVASRAD